MNFAVGLGVASENQSFFSGLPGIELFDTQNIFAFSKYMNQDLVIF